MEDEEFLFQVENCILNKDHFSHQGRIRIAWLFLSHHVFEHAMIRISQSIFFYANSLGAADNYHETITKAWIHLVYNAMSFKELTFDEFMKRNDYLLNKKLPLQYYSPNLLSSHDAKENWIEPDLKPLYHL